MASTQEAPVYLQIRRSNLENIGIIITDPFDFSQVVPYVSGYINTVQNQYFKASVNTTTQYFDYSNIDPNCPNQTVRVYYNLDELSVAGASPFSPVLYSSTLGLLAGSQQFIGIERSLGCYESGGAPTNPKKFKMVFNSYNEKDPSTNQYIVRSLGVLNNPIAAVVSTPPGYDAIGFAPDNPIDNQNPASTAPGVYYFRIHPIVEIKIIP